MVLRSGIYKINLSHTNTLPTKSTVSTDIRKNEQKERVFFVTTKQSCKRAD